MPPVADLAVVAVPVQAHAAPVHANGWKPVVVQPGDTVWQLAVTHRTTVAALTAKNGLQRSGRDLVPGQRLLVPAAPTPAAGAGTSRPGGSYVVRAGDTMEAIAASHGTSLSDLLRRNPGIGADLICPGQRLSVPASSPAARATAKRATVPVRTHTVRQGETMTGIAAAYGIRLDRLTAANRGVDPDVLLVGQRLSVPRANGATRAGTPATASSGNTFAGRTYPDATVRAAAANRAALAHRAVPSRTQTAALIRQVAARHGVDPRLALAIAYQESGWNHRMVSVANAIGVMQVIPSSGEWASALAGRRLDLLDHKDNITAGVLILRALQSTASSREEAVAGYYQGLASVRARGMFADTEGYVRTVLALRERM